MQIEAMIDEGANVEEALRVPENRPNDFSGIKKRWLVWNTYQVATHYMC